MLSIWRTSRRYLHAPRWSSITGRTFSTCLRTRAPFQLGDRVWIQYRSGKNIKHKLSGRLQEDGATGVGQVQVSHSSIVGQEAPLRLDLSLKNGEPYPPIYIEHPSLDDFTSHTPRRMQPIYASYAASIVDLLDIHVDPYGTTDTNFRIVEAGTGNGGLTIQLAKAITAGNKPVPVRSQFASQDEFNTEIANWKPGRRAVIDTFDIDKLNPPHVSKTIGSFRGGVYLPHIDFHHGDLKAVLPDRYQEESIDVMVLDMPDVHANLAVAAPLLKLGGKCLVFVPQLTQIAVCVQKIQSQNLPYRLDKVLELGDGISTGRTWDVRMATVRKLQREQSAASSDEEDQSDTGSDRSAIDTDITIPPMVSRPKVFEMTRGGGFVALWKKIKF